MLRFRLTHRCLLNVSFTLDILNHVLFFCRDDLWFDDVDPDDIEAAIGAEAAEMMRKKQGIKKDDKNPETALVKEKAFDG